ncbi:hypothetical protein HMPREF2564_06985 [Staphylococcus sp. HMSC068D03]|nr:hypothetical protein HMPREF2620_07635 [Staphylococcus sp. HMSC077B09]OFV31200.1 hypothetical protein HMPREF3134_00240 [Staphylococcus sp. HMSC14D10]OHP80594.1 hypothetical protein HMPREF2544_11325 [Staphylococcus sp. HMSC063A11]OHQ33304.1 hypothetical protein HMPREF2564_06985 [Staphylococcus sp. HMSC068D03]OHR09024.1 hypothetical protein HMPREF2587_01725 [Staphylococcus sp. HMSC078A08]OHR96132.1 hypothetical protein HMPREF3246_10775 [Staphylococcus sp. HMSC36A02]
MYNKVITLIINKFFGKLILLSNLIKLDSKSLILSILSVTFMRIYSVIKVIIVTPVLKRIDAISEKNIKIASVKNKTIKFVIK